MAKAVTTRIPGVRVDNSDDLFDPDLLQDVARLVKALKSSGVLPMVTALLEQRDDVLAILMRVVNTPDVKRAIVQIEGLLQTLSRLSPGFTGAVQSGVERGLAAASRESDGSMTVFSLLKALRNPDIARAIRVSLAFLEGFGHQIGE